ncbi:MAG: hypothetical protein FIA99_11150 [Ruminiclostridium sp.]|nr:hypothetical protein [Ruminiclostridium sp.]
MNGVYIMNSGLYPSVFRPLQVKEIKPEGWLLNQLKIQAAGLSGNLDKFWPDIKDSQWIGGKAEGWERVPYWLDGFIPLAWLLNDEDMKDRARRYISYIIEHQAADGWICPESNGNRQTYDVWALLLILKVLVLYHDATRDSRIEEVVRKALLALERHIDMSTLFNWGQTRWYEGLISVWWLYERTGEEWLLDLAGKLNCQGFDWFSLFKRWPYKKPNARGHWSQMSHAVNYAMMLKAGVLLWRLTGAQDHLDAAEGMVNLLDEYHGMVTGVFTGDECLAGTSPVQGTELCAVGEYMYSLEQLVAVTGRAHWGDRLEKIAYNALPATFSPDMWTHQYVQQVNQVECSRHENPIFTTNSGESHLFGLEPNYGCCTANLSQPWPKFALSTFMRSTDGLAAVVYAPCTVNTVIKGIKVSVTLETDYPFSDTLIFKVKPESQVEFPMYLRIPEWAQNAAIEIDGNRLTVKTGYFHKLNKKWEGEISFTLRLPMKPMLVSRPENLYAVTCGPLVYSIPIGERWVQINKNIPGREFPHCDYEIYPTTPWNYALCIDKANVESMLKLESYPVGDCPFSPEGAPAAIRVKGRKVDWIMENKSAAPSPRMDWISDDTEELLLIPYGCTNLRMTEMPLV